MQAFTFRIFSLQYIQPPEGKKIVNYPHEKQPENCTAKQRV